MANSTPTHLVQGWHSTDMHAHHTGIGSIIRSMPIDETARRMQSFKMKRAARINEMERRKEARASCVECLTEWSMAAVL